MARTYAYHTVEIDICEFLTEHVDDDLLKEECEHRGFSVGVGVEPALLQLYEAKKYGLGDFDALLEALFLEQLGKSL